MGSNENKKKIFSRLRITPLDIALLLLVVLIVISIWQKNQIQLLFERQKQEKSYTVTFELEGIRPSAAETITAGAELYFYDADRKIPLGKLSEDPTLFPYSQDFINAQGSSMTVLYPMDDRQNGRVTLCGAFVCHGFKNDHVLVHEEGLQLQLDGYFLIATEIGEFEAKVVSIVEIEA